jgi:hypothetical protein
VTPTSHEKWRAALARSRRAASRASRGVASLFASVNERPTFILGNQKSGTTAIAALLGEMTGLSVTLDLKREMRHPVIDGIKLGRMSMAEFVRLNRLDFSRAIIKEPSLSPFYHELSERFPRAKFVMVIRDPRDNLRSILNRLKIPGSLPGLTEESTARLTRAWLLIVDGRWLGLEGRNYIEMLAGRWNYIANLYLGNSDRMPLIRYEDFSKDKTGTLELVAEKLGFERKFDVSGRVDVQFQPAGDRNVRWIDFFGSKNLATIESVCAEGMLRLGYPPTP